MSSLLEIACFDLASAQIAAKAGAHRIEFCDQLRAGGTTPDENDTKKLLGELSIPVFVMIRPRGGDFVYTPDEFAQMKKSIEAFKTMGVHGFVFGILRNDHTLDLERNTELVQLAHPLPCTLHRAFDHTPGLMITLKEAARCGFTRILTSGGKGNAPDNPAMLAQLVKHAGHTLTILPGGGIRSSNIAEIKKTSGATEYHSSAITPNSGSAADPAEIQKLLDALA